MHFQEVLWFAGVTMQPCRRWSPKLALVINMINHIGLRYGDCLHQLTLNSEPMPKQGSGWFYPVRASGSANSGGFLTHLFSDSCMHETKWQ